MMGSSSMVSSAFAATARCSALSAFQSFSTRSAKRRRSFHMMGVYRARSTGEGTVSRGARREAEKNRAVLRLSAPPRETVLCHDDTPTKSSTATIAPRSTSASASSIAARSGASSAMSIVSRSARYSSCEMRIAIGRSLRRKVVRLPVSSHSPTRARTSSGASRMSKRLSMRLRLIFADQRLEVRAKLIAQRRMAQRVIDGRLEIAEFFAGVVTLPFEDVAVKRAGANELAQRVGELDFAARTAFRFFEQREDVGRQDVASDDRVARRRLHLRLLDHVRNVKATVAERVAGHDS